MSSTLQDAAAAFADKARRNAHFAVTAIRERSLDSPPPGVLVGYQPANQLVVDGLELLLKALRMRRDEEPRLTHKLSTLYADLTEPDKEDVDAVVRDAIAESSSGEVPFGLPNEGGVVLLKSFTLGVDQAEEDRTRGYADMDALGFFKMLDAEWPAEVTKYVGLTRSLNVNKQTMRVDARVFAGSALVCLKLADRILGPEPPVPEFVHVLQESSSGRFAATVAPLTATDDLHEAHLFETIAEAIDALRSLDVAGWIARGYLRAELTEDDGHTAQ